MKNLNQLGYNVNISINLKGEGENPKEISHLVKSFESNLMFPPLHERPKLFGSDSQFRGMGKAEWKARYSSYRNIFVSL